MTALNCLTLEVYYRSARTNAKSEIQDNWKITVPPRIPVRQSGLSENNEYPDKNEREESKKRTGNFQKLLGENSIDELIEKAKKDNRGKEAQLLLKLFDAAPAKNTPLEERLKISRQKDFILIGFASIWPYDYDNTLSIIKLALANFTREEVFMLLCEKSGGRSRLNLFLRGAKTKKDSESLQVLLALAEPVRDLKNAGIEDRQILELKKGIYEELAQRYSYDRKYVEVLMEILKSLGEKDKVVRFLTSRVDVSPDDENVRVQCARALQKAGYYEEACEQFEEAARLRPEQVTCYFEGARCAELLGSVGFQKAEKLYKDILKLNLPPGSHNVREATLKLHKLYLREIKRAKKTGDKEKESKIKDKIEKLTGNKLVFKELRIVLKWDTAGTDVDLWITAPGHQKCNYQQKQTLAGGLLDKDDTDGHGPETYTLGKLVPGRYLVQVNYYKGLAKTTGTVEIITYEGTERENRKTYDFCLTRCKETLTIFEGSFK